VQYLKMIRAKRRSIVMTLRLLPYKESFSLMLLHHNLALSGNNPALFHHNLATIDDVDALLHLIHADTLQVVDDSILLAGGIDVGDAVGA